MNQHELDQLEAELAAAGNTPRRNLRVGDNLWENYLAAAVAHGSNASAAARAFMRALIVGDPHAVVLLNNYAEGAADE